MCRNRNKSFSGKRRSSNEKFKFYKSLRGYLIFHIFLFGLVISGFGGFGLWPVTLFWGLGLVVHYIKAFGLPGTNGWFSAEWEEWMATREEKPTTSYEESLDLTPLERQERRAWRDSDLV